MSNSVPAESSAATIPEVSAADVFYEGETAPETRSETAEATAASEENNEPASADEAGETETESGPETETTEEPSQTEANLKPKTAKRIDTLLKRNKELEKQLASLAQPATEKKVEDPEMPVAPDPNTFDGTWEELQAAYSKYVTDRSAYDVKKAVEADRKAQSESARQAQFDEYKKNVEAIWNKRQDKAIERTPAYKELVLDANGKIKPTIAKFINQTTDGFLVDSEIGPEILGHLAAHPEEFSKLSQMNPYQTARELTRLETALSEKLKGPSKVTRAPRPITTVSSNSSAVGKDIPDEELFYQ